MCGVIDRRIAKTAAKARDAALDVLAEGGFAAFTMEAVAERSGVAKSTLYRHWPGRLALLIDALETLNRQPSQAEPVDGGQFRARVIELVSHLAKVFEGSRISRVMPALIEAAEHHPEVGVFLYNYSATRRDALVQLLRSGVDLGELGPDFDPELGSLMLSGPIFYCRLMSAAPFPSKNVAELVDFALFGRKRTCP